MEVLLGLLIFWLSCGAAGYLMGSQKGVPIAGFWLSFLLGPIGVLITYLLDGDRVPCESCRKLVAPDARKCPYCQSEIVPVLKLDELDAIKKMLHVESELREILSETAFEVFRLHKRKDGIFASANMTIDRDLSKVKQVDRAYDELESLGLIECMDVEVGSCPDGPMRRARRLTDRGKRIEL